MNSAHDVIAVTPHHATSSFSGANCHVNMTRHFLLHCHIFSTLRHHVFGVHDDVTMGKLIGSQGQEGSKEGYPERLAILINIVQIIFVKMLEISGL